MSTHNQQEDTMTIDKPMIKPSFAGLISLVDKLRGPTGCPWDAEQDMESLVPLFLDECYELVDAMEVGDNEDLIEEIGDVLFHIAFQISLGKSDGRFNENTVCIRTSEKYKRRHPHVFGDGKADSIEEVEMHWERIKREEKVISNQSELDGIPKSLPALSYALAIQKRASKTGFDWTSATELRAKVWEEINEIDAAESLDEKREELGDLLFTIVNECRWMKIDPEQALRQSNRKFFGRLKGMERICKEENMDFSSLKPTEKDLLWDRAKLQESKG